MEGSTRTSIHLRYEKVIQNEPIIKIICILVHDLFILIYFTTECITVAVSYLSMHGLFFIDHKRPRCPEGLFIYAYPYQG